VTCDLNGNRSRWPELAKVVDEMRTFFPTLGVVNVYQNGQLVAGRELDFEPDLPRLPKCKCGCIPPFCNCDPDGEVVAVRVRSKLKRFEMGDASDLNYVD